MCSSGRNLNNASSKNPYETQTVIGVIGVIGWEFFYLEKCVGEA